MFYGYRICKFDDSASALYRADTAIELRPFRRSGNKQYGASSTPSERRRSIDLPRESDQRTNRHRGHSLHIGRNRRNATVRNVDPRTVVEMLHARRTTDGHRQSVAVESTRSAQRTLSPIRAAIARNHQQSHRQNANRCYPSPNAWILQPWANICKPNL